MCIRDSIKSAFEITVDILKKSNIDVLRNQLIYCASIQILQIRMMTVPVSYTHLDVYKRQGFEYVLNRVNPTADKCTLERAVAGTGDEEYKGWA